MTETDRAAISSGQLAFAVDLGIGYWELDLATGDFTASELCRAVFGRSADQPFSYEDLRAAIHPDDRQRHADEVAAAIEARSRFDIECRLYTPQGELRWVEVRGRFKGTHPAGRLVGVSLDVTDRNKAEEALRQSEERVRQFGEASSDVLWIRNADTLQWEYLTPAFQTIYGLDREKALAGDKEADWIDLVMEEDRDTVSAAMEQVRAGERQTFEFRIRRPPDGQLRWIRNIDFPMKDDSGRVIRFGGIGHDITQLKQSEQRQKLLLAELQHRVRNTLGVIRSIARRTAANSETVEDYAMHLEGRIDAFARVQTAVTRDPTGGIDLIFVVAEELRAALAEEGRNVWIDGPPVHLKPKAAESLALAIHELATNALKYGALSVDGGRMEIVWTVDREAEPPVLDFRWRERGMAGLSAVPTRRGFGLELLEKTLAYDLKAETTLSFEPTGIECRIVLPLDRVLAG